MPNPSIALVARISGWAATCLASSGDDGLAHGGEGRGLQLVGLGQDDLVVHGRRIHHFHDVAVRILESVPAVHQHQGPAQGRPALQVKADEVGPDGDLVLGRLCESVSRQVGHDQPVAQVEEIDFLGAAGGVGGARQGAAGGQGVDQAGLAHIGAAGEGDLRQVGVRHLGEFQHAPQEAAGLREQPPARLRCPDLGRVRIMSVMRRYAVFAFRSRIDC